MQSLTALLEELAEDRKLGPQLSTQHILPVEPERLGEFPAAIPESLRELLAVHSIEQLYRHQQQGLAAAMAGEDVLITTPTASGKSLIFQLPPLAAELNGEPGRALYLYPLKALGRDQEAKISGLAAAAGCDPGWAAVYDGDTAKSERKKIRQQPPRVLITNPDMLHLGILPSWQSWTPFLAELRWIVLDELHAYRGAFGAHLHHVLWRLQRLCRQLGAEPRLIASSATAANALEFAQTLGGQALAGREFRWIQESGAARERRHIVILDPIGSAYTAAVDLTAFLLDRGLKTIVFTKARRVTELLYTWLIRQRPDLAPRVKNYRSGFLAGERRQIEADLFSGKLDGVISTSALELGIDVGGLDACVLVGFPGSVMATWQRSGRVGRDGRDSITALVPLPDALDRYFVEHPQELTTRACEPLVVDIDNPHVVRAQLLCAATEEPLAPTEESDALGHRQQILATLTEEKLLTEGEDGRLYSTQARPHNQVSLRGGGDSFLVLDSARQQIIGTLDGIRLLREGHPGAVYLHGGRQYLVRELDFDGNRVRGERVEVNYFTQPLTEKCTEVLEILGHRTEGLLEAWHGRLRVTERVVGFERRKIQGRELLDRHELELPPMVVETEGLWWLAPANVQAHLVEAGYHFMGALHAAEHTTIGLLPLFAVCDRGDLGGISIPLHSQVRSGAVFVYDGHAGGAGITARAFAQLPEVLTRVRDHLQSCTCEDGCPSCVQSPKCGNGNRPLDKKGAEDFLSLILEGSPTEHDPPAVRVAPEWEEPAWQAPPPPEDVVRSGKVMFDLESLADVGTTRGAAWLSDLGEPARQATATELHKLESNLVLKPDLVNAAQGPPQSSSAIATQAANLPPPRPQNPRKTLLFDLETQKSAADVGGWQNIHRMRVAIGVSLDLQQGEMRVFKEDQVDDLIEQLASADLVIGYNIIRFDYLVLSGYTGAAYHRLWPTLDLYQEVYRSSGMRLSMNALAQETLGEGKSANGLTSLRWVAEGKLDKVTEYCRRDVEVLRDLYLYGRRMGYLLVSGEHHQQLRIPVGW